MNDGRQIYSKSLKKTLVKSQHESVQKSIDSKPNTPNSLRRFLTDGLDECHIILPFEQSVYFPVNFKSALSKDYSEVVSLYKVGVDLHNKHLVGGRFPDDGFEWFNEPEISDFQSRLYTSFSSIGKALAHKKRRKSPYEAQLFLFKNVTSPLDDFTWKDGCRLDFLFQHAIDLLVQSYLSCFLGGYINAPQNTTLNNRAPIAHKNFCKTPLETQFLDEQIKLYNVQDYMSIEDTVREVSKALLPNTTQPSISNESLLFDIYELIPLYIKSWSPDSNRILLNEHLAVYLMMDYGFPSFVIGNVDVKAINLATSTLRFSWTITNEFRSAGKLDISPEIIKNLGDFVLNEFHDKLVSLFAIRKTRTKQDEPTEYVNDYIYEVADFTSKYHQALSNIGSVKENQHLDTPRINVPSMMMSSFFTFMQKTFDCNVHNGKGSEMKIWRNGSKIYSLGRHKQEQKIPSLLIKKILKRLDITTEEWLRLLQKD